MKNKNESNYKLKQFYFFYNSNIVLSIKLFIFISLFILYFILKKLFNDKIINNILLKKIEEIFALKEYVNINEIESMIIGGRAWNKSINKKKEINIGIQLDPNYVLRVMMTSASIMDSQKKSTKIRFHFAVVLNFKARHMMKIYSLRKKIRNDVEFNFYNAKRVETDLKGLNTKGPGAIAKLLLPELLPNDIERLIILDTGDLLVLRDLSSMYNFNMKNYLYLGLPGGKVGKYALASKKNFTTYINTGSMLVNVKKIKEEKIYEKYKKYKSIYKSAVGDQDLLNDVALGKISFLPLKFGICSPYKNDKDSDKPLNEYPYKHYIRGFLYNKFPYISKNRIIQFGYNPMVIHQFNGKWMFGKGLTIYRRLAQYYIKLAGIWDELCLKFPGYCIK